LKTDGYSIRPLEENEAHEVRDIAYKSWMWTYKDIYSTDFIKNWIAEKYDPEKIGRDITKSRNAADIIFLGSFFNRVMVGFLEAKIDGRIAEVFRMYILPEHTHKGISMMLMKTAERELLLRGVDSIMPYVHSQNSMGIGFYKKMMFRELRIYGDDLVMYKRLFQ